MSPPTIIDYEVQCEFCQYIFSISSQQRKEGEFKCPRCESIVSLDYVEANPRQYRGEAQEYI